MLFKNHFRNAVLALIIANIIWGAAPPIFKWTLFDIGPYTLAFLRFFIAAILLLLFAYKDLAIEKKDFLKIFILALSGVTINIIFFFWGLKFAPSINASIIGSAGPIFLIFASFFILKEKPKNKLILGSLIGLIGVILIMFKSLFLKEPNLDLLGNFFYFIAMVAGLGQTITGRNLIKKYSPQALTFWSFFIGAVSFFPLYIIENTNSVPHFTLHAISGIAFGALLSSLVAYFLFFWALKYMTASNTGIFVYLDPLITVLIALPLLGEKPDSFYYVGAILVFCGIYVAEGRLQYHPLHLLHKRDG